MASFAFKRQSRHRIHASVFLFIFVITSLPAELLSQPEESALVPASKPIEKTPPNLYVEEFFLHPEMRLQHETTEVNGLLFIKTPNQTQNTNYSIVTDFKGGVLKSRFVPGLINADDIRKWLEKNQEESTFEGVTIRKIQLPAVNEGGQSKTFYWVGQRSFKTADGASSEIALTKSVSEAQSLDFTKMVTEAKNYMRLPEDKPAVEIKSEAQYAREEAIALKWADQLDLGEQLFGPFQGIPSGEPLLWQSFGETTYRNTNLEDLDFNNQVGFWTNRVVFKGIRAPFSTVDPYLEATASVESVETGYKSNLKLFAGLEWRPLVRNAWLYNFRPWGLPLLIWARNFRTYIQYGDRIHLKDEITGSRNHDLLWGMQIFYEWGIDLPSVTEGPPATWQDYVGEYVWGEYFGDYRVEMTNFSSSDDFDALIANSSIILGVRLPGIPLPDNPINDRLVFMPYLRFEHTNNSKFAFDYQNRYFVAAGVRWMPFRTYRFKENEWLSKVKIFGEYVGMGGVQFSKQEGTIREDYRVGVSVSSRRF